MPRAHPLADGRVSYAFRLRPDLRFQRDPCFEAITGSDAPRSVRASDFAFQLARIADPAVGSPIVDTFSVIEGFAGFGARLEQRRASDPDFAALPVHEQYAEVGPISGVRTADEQSLEIVLTAPYPQLLYWFAMPFTTAVAWEAVAYYDGEEGRPAFSDHPVGTGPYRMVHYDKQARIVLEQNPEWYGRRHPEWKAAGSDLSHGGCEAGDRERGLLDPADVGTALPRIERVEFRRERELIPMFAKFLQGYYDLALVVRESFDQVISRGDLSPDMAARGIRLDRSVPAGRALRGFSTCSTRWWAPPTGTAPASSVRP